MDQQEWLELAKDVRAAYVSKPLAAPADKAKLTSVINAFEAVYDDRSTNNEEKFYIGTLVQSGRIEGKAEEILGTVKGAIQRTIHHVTSEPNIDCMRAALYSRTLVNCLEKEKFKSNLDTTLANYRVILEDIAKGNV